MVRYLARRLVYYVILAFIATSLTYLMASLSFNPRAAYEARNPAPPAEVINAQLSAIGVNDEDPLLERYGAWVSYRPPVEALSWPLYAAPIALLAVGAWLLAVPAAA